MERNYIEANSATAPAPQPRSARSTECLYQAATIAAALLILFTVAA